MPTPCQTVGFHWTHDTLSLKLATWMQAFRGGSGFFGLSGVFVRYSIHVGDGFVDLADPGRLLARDRGDLRNEIRDKLYA